MEAAPSSSTITDGGDGGQPPPAPAPMPAANAPPPFLVKTYDMVEDPSTDKIVSWSPTNNSFVVWDSAEFAKELLPKYFKHNNFSSFVRQLNTYLCCKDCKPMFSFSEHSVSLPFWDFMEKQGFRKVDPDRWEFANEGFLRGQKHLLKTITRRKPAHGHPPQLQQPNAQTSVVGACVEVGKFGLEEEVERLKRDKNVLMQELVRLRQQQQNTDGQLQAMVQRLQGMEQRQQQMMSFLAKAVNSPGFLAQFMQQPANDGSRRIAEGSKKRRLKQECGSDDNSIGASDGQIVKYQPLMNEAAKAMLRQIVKPDSSPRLENFGNDSDSFLIGDDSSSNVLDCGSSSNRVSGVTLQEVPPTLGPSFISSNSAISDDQFPVGSPLMSGQEMPLPAITLPPTDTIIPELSQIVPESSNIDMMESLRLPLEIDGFSPDPQIEWDNYLLDEKQELPGVSDPFWEKFLQSPPPVEADMDMTLTDDPRPERSDTKPVENGWDKSQHMAELTEQMGLLTPDAKKI